VAKVVCFSANVEAPTAWNAAARRRLFARG